MSPMAYPGDGVCPTASQFYTTHEASYRAWKQLASTLTFPREPESFCVAEQLLSFLQQIPPFKSCESIPFSFLDEPYPQVKFILEWETTTDLTCQRRAKQFQYFQTIGLPETTKFEFSTDTACSFLERAGMQTGYISDLILAWTYVLSCRLLEILQFAGENVNLFLDQEITTPQDFWDVISNHRWRAFVIRGARPFYTPWSLEDQNSQARVMLHKASPNSSLAFDILVGFCESHNLVEECAVALAVVLMIPEHVECSVKIPHPSKSIHRFPNYDFEPHSRGRYYSWFHEAMDSAITLSCIPQGIDSILTSTFFDPTIPCNLAGAHLTGIARALESLKGKHEHLALLMIKRNPEFGPLWLAALCCGRISMILTSATGGLPPVHLGVASWVQNLQSFVQAQYTPAKGKDTVIPRAREYVASCLIKPNTLVPVTPWPPFGETQVLNTDLEVREHLSHDHRALRYRTYWVLNNGECLPTTQVLRILPIWDAVVQATSTTDLPCTKELIAELDEANNISSDTTFNLLNWHKNNEGGLWLAEEGSNIREIRRIQAHPWIQNDSDDDALSEDTSDESTNKQMIVHWQASLLSPGGTDGDNSIQNESNYFSTGTSLDIAHA